MNISDLVLKLLRAKRITFPFIGLSFTLAIFSQFGPYINMNQFWGSFLGILITVSFIVYLIFACVLMMPNDDSSFTFGGILVAISAIGILGKIIPDPSMIKQVHTFWFIGLAIWGLFEIEYSLVPYGGSLSN